MPFVLVVQQKSLELGGDRALHRETKVRVLGSEVGQEAAGGASAPGCRRPSYRVVRARLNAGREWLTVLGRAGEVRKFHDKQHTSPARDGTHGKPSAADPLACLRPPLCLHTTWQPDVLPAFFLPFQAKELVEELEKLVIGAGEDTAAVDDATFIYLEGGAIVSMHVDAQGAGCPA